MSSIWMILNGIREEDLIKYQCGYALSSRSKCVGCGMHISEGEVRIAKMENRGRPIPCWHHVGCFTDNRSDYEFWDSAEDIPGFWKLNKDDRDDLMLHLPRMNPLSGENESSEDDDDQPEENESSGDEDDQSEDADENNVGEKEVITISDDSEEDEPPSKKVKTSVAKPGETKKNVGK